MTPIINAVIPVFLTVLLGYVLAKRDTSFDTPTIAFLTSQVGGPAPAMYTLIRADIPAEAFLTMTLATLVAFAVFLLVGATILRLAGLERRSFLPSIAFPNTANLGLPLALYAYGTAGLGYATVIFAIMSVCHFVIGQAIAAGKSNWKAALFSPVVLAALVGIGGASLHVTLPTWLMNFLSLVSGLTIPLMLMMLGTSLAKIRLKPTGRILALAALRIGMGVATGFAVAALFGFTGVERAVLVLQCSMPVAIYNYLLAMMWNTEAEQVASLVVTSTLLSLVTIPLLLAVL
jgi:predicted permease